MRQFSARIARLHALPAGSVLAEIAGPVPGGLAPGQFYLARPAGLGRAPDPYLRSPLFPESFGPEGMMAELPPALSRLSPGDEIDLIGPCGRGFVLPNFARNVLLIAGDAGLSRLRPIANDALARRASVTLFCEHSLPLADWPPEVEVRFGPAHLSDAIEWADTICADLVPGALRELQVRLRAGERPRPAFGFYQPPAPCGVGACGACAVSTAGGWKLACVDGPLFELSEIQL